jgi:heat shock protein HtpX
MMWELIAANRRKSMFLFVGMAALLCALGYLIGHVVLPDGGGNLGLIVAIGLWMLLSAVSVFGGSDLILRLSHAREVTPDVHPQLFNVVEEMKIAAALPALPKVYIIDERAPNAFATGQNPQNSAVAVTAGLLSRLNRDELQGVVAHEMSHIVNRDVQFMTLASIMLGSIVLMSQVFLRGMWFTGGGSSRRYRGKGGGGAGPANAVLIVAAIVLAILGPIFARLLYMAISRKREYLADASAARLTRYPEGLASALEKISENPLALDVANKVTSPMYIVNPLRSKEGVPLSGLGSTHPPIGERIAILRAMSQGAGLLSYQRAYSKVKGKPSMIIPPSGLKKDKDIAVREPHPDAVADRSGKAQARDVMDLMRAVNGYAFLMCACGLKIKVPADYEDASIPCPRCKRENQIPRAAVSDITEAAAVVTAMVGALAVGKGDTGEVPMAKPIPGSPVDPERAPLEYRRRSDGWESFACACGHMLQISPAFTGSQMRCPQCDRITRIN